MGPQQKRMVLVVDDEPDAVEFVRAVMEEAGYAVMSAGNAEECAAALEQATPDLLVLDVNMPGRAGFYVLRDLKADPSTKDIPVIMLTGVAEQVGIAFSTEDLYLEKPVDPDYLGRVAGELLGGGKGAREHGNPE
jgi:CheY-like chemotaxis protein